MVMIRSVSGIKPESTLRSVVLPAPVPPEIRMFSLARMADLRKSNISDVNESPETRSFMVMGVWPNFRMDSTGPLRARGGMITFTLDPSGRRASTMGEDSSIRRPTAETILSIICMR